MLLVVMLCLAHKIQDRLVERKSGFAIIKKLKARTKDEVTRAATEPVLNFVCEA